MTNKVQLLTPLHRSYPKNLREIKDSPKVIYLEGKLQPKDRIALAVIGSRNPSFYGRKVTRIFVRALVKSGFTIISGLARGIDTIAHQTALKSGGRTIAVLGTGLDLIYPRENDFLAGEIVKNGALISEFPLGTQPKGKNFLERNRLIAGLSRGILVIEGAKRSGTLSTASHAANQGREVFAIPGPIDSQNSQAPNYLISQGAIIALRPEDIIEYLSSTS